MEDKMFDVKRQKQALLARLEYYKTTFPYRSQEYQAFKLKHSLPRINVALQRLVDGNYGDCATCGEYIGDRRLHLVPGALHCFGCQTYHEEKIKARLT